MKLQAIKKQIVLLITLIVVSITLMSFTNKVEANVNNDDEQPMYYVVSAWEYIYNQPGKGQPVISNVVYVKCEGHNQLGATNSFKLFYDTFYRKQRGTSGIERANAFRFDTRDEAIKKRRELIADRNRDWNPLLVTDFTVTCDH